MNVNSRFGRVAAVAGLLVACGGSASSAGALHHRSTAEAAADLSARQVTRQLAGEWEGQLEVRSDDGALSASAASMSARMGRHGSLEIYYEGFAFGEASDGAFIFAAGERPNQGSLFAHDSSLGLEVNARGATWQHDHEQTSESDSFRMAGRAESSSTRDARVRAEFQRHSARSWEIQFQAQNAEGDWEPTLTLKMERLPEGQRSAAADNINSSMLLASLRNDATVAGVQTDD